MGILRHLQHWLIGRGPQLLTTEFVPETHAIRLWADTFPWEALVQAVEQSFAQRFPKKRPQGGRPPVSSRVLLALELLKHELGASDEDICQRLRTDVAVMYACGLREVHVDRLQAQFWPPVSRPGQSLCQVGARNRTPPLSPGESHGNLEPARQRMPASRQRAEYGPTRASAARSGGRPCRPSAHHHTIAAPHPRQKTCPLQNCQCL